MENKIKKIVLSILITLTLTLTFVFGGTKKANAETWYNYDGTAWYLNNGTLISNDYTASLSAQHYYITSQVSGSATTFAFFQTAYGSSTTNYSFYYYVIDFTVTHPTSTTTYIMFDFYSINNLSHIGTLSYCDIRVSFYSSNASSSSFMYLSSVASPSGANAGFFKYWLNAYGVRISSLLVGGSTYSSTVLNTDTLAIQLFNKCFSNLYIDTETSFNNGYQAGYNEGVGDGETSGYDSGYNAGVNSVDTSVYYDSGYNAGVVAGVNSVNTSTYYNNGYQAGYNAGLTASSQDYGISDLLFSIFSVPIAVLSNLFDFNIFGSNVWAVIVSLLIVSIVIWILKKTIFTKD